MKKCMAKLLINSPKELLYVQGVPKKMFLSEMLRGRIFLNTPSFSMDKMRRI